MRNPLVASILTLLKAHPDGISEFDILKTLKQQHPTFNELADDANLQLFRQHFLIMNALYQLQGRLWREDNLVLEISSLKIKLTSKSVIPKAQQQELDNSADVKLAAYYLDWQEYQKTDEAEVSRLLESFYLGTCYQTGRQEALKTLAIDHENPSKVEIKQHYRKLVQKHHPDLGGDPETFIALRQAYEQLML